MKKAFNLIFFILLIIVVISILYFIKSPSSSNNLKNISCSRNSDCADGLVCSPYSSNCVKSIQDEQLNRSMSIHNSNINAVRYSLVNLSNALTSGSPSQCIKLDDDENVKDVGNNPIILVPGKRTCLILLAIQTKNESVCDYLNNTRPVDFEQAPDFSNYPNLARYSDVFTYNSNASKVLYSGNIQDCIDLIR